MKKWIRSALMIILVLMMMFVLTACTTHDITVQNDDGSQTVIGALLETTATTVCRLLFAAMLSFGTWALQKIGKNEKMKNLSGAIQFVLDMTRQTAGELQQTIVNELKADRPDGKLTEDDVYTLGIRLRNTVKIKVDMASQELIKAAGIDINAIISGECESYLNKLKTDPLISIAAPAPDPIVEKTV